ncbi:uncharacterized protein TNCT_381441 [Trichonephila clavata]|uniref:DUF19 domain-containing protein n=1 Tax=Trichonephila clavata TaxID=2740835 RepID=A0A8X6EZJ7_TRICU|nr:uncharacterized protein TNCT_381441 [Trichonephila clavata]
MKFLCVVLLAGYLGVVLCDLDCMGAKVGKCNIERTSKLNFRDDPLCGENRIFYKCMKSGSQECNMENSAFITKMLQNLDEICTNGSSKNALYLKHKYCIYEKVPMLFDHCIEQFFKELSEIPKTGDDKYHEAIFNLTCKWNDSIEECIEDAIREKCGEEAVMFRRYFKDPSFQISNKFCELEKETAQ